MSSVDAAEMIVLNAGSATIRGALFSVSSEGVARRSSVTRELGSRAGVSEAFEDVLAYLSQQADEVRLFTHRVVHGGMQYQSTVEIDDAVEVAIEEWGALAPLHNPVALAGLRAARKRFPTARHFAAFDTAFHADRDSASLEYNLPRDVCKPYPLRRFGFHGIAHAALTRALAAEVDQPPEQVSAVTLQLGGGCSACAIENGRSIETSMGFSPLGGLPMGSRSGDLDPGVLLALVRDGWDAKSLERLLSLDSGLRGLSGKSNMQDVLSAEVSGDPSAKLAVDHFVRAVVMETGAYLTLLGGTGSIVFGGGIGRYASSIRERVAEGLRGWDVELDLQRNQRGATGLISRPGTRPVFVFETDEESGMAEDTVSLLMDLGLDLDTEREP